MTTGRPEISSEPLRDPRFDAAWRAASREEPPVALDATILGAARRAVGAGPQRVAVREATRPERWWWPLAAAASIGAVAIGILQLAAPDRAGAPDPARAMVSDMPVERPSAASPAPPSAPPFVPAPAAKPQTSVVPPQPKSGSDAAARKESAGLRQETSRLPTPDASRAAVPLGGTVAPPAGPARDEHTAAGAPNPPPSGGDAAASGRSAQPFPAGAAAPRRMESDSARPAALGKVMPPPAVGARADAQTKERAPLPVAEWIALIRKLRAEGRTEEVAREVAAFLAAYPDQQHLLVDDPAGSTARPPAPAR